MSDVINTTALWTVACDHPGCGTSYTAAKTDEPNPGALDELESAGWHIGAEHLDDGSIDPDLCPEHNR